MRKQHLKDAYRFPGFIPAQEIKADDLDDGARVIVMKRRQKKQRALSVNRHIVRIMTTEKDVLVTCPAEICGYTSKSRYVASSVRDVPW